MDPFQANIVIKPTIVDFLNLSTGPICGSQYQSVFIWFGFKLISFSRPNINGGNGRSERRLPANLNSQDLDVDMEEEKKRNEKNKEKKEEDPDVDLEEEEEKREKEKRRRRKK